MNDIIKNLTPSTHSFGVLFYSHRTLIDEFFYRSSLKTCIMHIAGLNSIWLEQKDFMPLSMIVFFSFHCCAFFVSTTLEVRFHT